ncbi:MAG: hypothetical protein U0586_14670 [Candidatus Brocadiaceae bacterium]
MDFVRPLASFRGLSEILNPKSETDITHPCTPLVRGENPQSADFVIASLSACAVPAPQCGRQGHAQAGGAKQSAIQIPKSSTGVVLKEEFVGGKVSKISGERAAETKVSYFKGNDPSKWKSNISTYEFVDLGDVYKGIGLKLKAYGKNVEKLFCVKPGASPEQIKIGLSGLKDCGMQNAECGIKNPNSEFQNPKLSVNENGELVAETELGAVKFTKPIAYQDIDGKRVEVEAKYVIRGRETSSVKDTKNTDTIHGIFMVSRLLPTIPQKTSSSTHCLLQLSWVELRMMVAIRLL